MNQISVKLILLKKQKIVLMIAVIGLVVVIIYGLTGTEAPIVKIDGTITEKKTEDGGTIIEVKETLKQPVEEEFPLTIKDFQIADAIHAMSHQKIKAEEKWSFLPLTAERVTRLIDVIESNKDQYENSAIYLRILTRWSVNDFSEIDREHNEIWELQDGTIGRATGILSHEEELKFIEKYYE